MKLFSAVLAVALVQIEYGIAYRIVGIFSHSGKSHLDTFTPVMKRLAEKGHDVTVISYHPSNLKLPNYRDVVIGNYEETYKHLDNAINLELVELLGGYLGKPIQYFTITRLAIFGQQACEAGYKSIAVQDFLKENSTFDLMITEIFNTNCFLPLARKFRSVLIGIHSATMMPWSAYQFGNPNNPAYIPNNFLPHSDKMSFFGRVENTAVLVFHKLFHDFFMLPSDRKFVSRYLETDTNLEDYMYNCTLLLVNSHFSLNLPKPLAPCVIEIGGIHIGNNKSLPQVSAFIFRSL